MSEEINKSKSVGIVGWWSNLNYGGVITYYALYQTLKDLGYDPMMIRRFSVNGKPRTTESIPSKFGERHYRLSPYCSYSSAAELNDLCAGFVAGSDQLYNPYLEPYAGKEYFLDFVSDDNLKFTYASSFGDAKTAPQPFIEKYKPLLTRLDAMSVREDFAVSIAKNLYDMDATQVLDPVFLAKPEAYDALADRSEEETGKGLLCFFLDPTPEKRALAERVAAEFGLEADFFLDMQHVEENVRNLEGVRMHPNCEPEALVKAYRDAKYVLTDSFHGTCLSVIFNKQFLSIANMKRGPKRFESILSLLGLMGRMTFETSYEAVKSILDSKIDYDSVNAVLDKERERSLQWMKHCLDGMEKKNHIRAALSMEECTSCSACANSCPVDAIRMTEDKDGFLKPAVNFVKCLNCGKCVRACGVLNATFTNRQQPVALAVMAEDDLRAVSSSGGAFTRLAEKTLREGGVVFGAAFTDDFKVEHIEVTDPEDIAKLRGSKYYASRIGDSYRKVKKYLEEGRKVLFSGVPCQISGLRTFLGGAKEGLFLVEILCHGITSEKVFRKYAKDVFNGKKIKAISFKPKKPWGWHSGVTALFEDGSTYAKPVESDAFYRSYLRGLNRASSCGTCPFSRIPRQGDVTIGDFWGIEKYDPALNDKKGTSLVLLNNEKGDAFMQGLSFPVCREVPLPFATAPNGALTHPFSHHPKRREFLDRLEKESYASLTRRFLAEEGGIDTVDMRDRAYFALAAEIDRRIGDRELLLLGDNGPLRRILSKYFGIVVDHFLTSYPQKVNERTEILGSVNGKRDLYFIVGVATDYDQSFVDKFKSFGFQEGKDFILKKKKPIVLENLDLSKGAYHDEYGNVIEGKGVLRRVVISGFANHVVIGESTQVSEIKEIRLSNNDEFIVEEGVKILGNTTIRMYGNMDGRASIRIGKKCDVRSLTIQLWNHPEMTEVTIGEECSFEENCAIYGSNGKKIRFGKDCLISRNAIFLLGEGHAIFDISSGKCVNNYEGNADDFCVIRDHVWVGINALLTSGTDVGSGSIIGVGAVVQGAYPNNVGIAGNIAKVVRKDIAWARAGYGIDISQCGDYAEKTKKQLFLQRNQRDR